MMRELPPLSLPCSLCGTESKILTVNGLTHWPESLPFSEWQCVLLNCIVCGENIRDLDDSPPELTISFD
jgi:hypothetical protein